MESPEQPARPGPADHDDPGGSEAGDVGERLAAWLEGLGVAAHLQEARLPRLTRDADGRAVWTDPGTGERLTGDQLDQLDQLLHHEGSEPQHAVPVPLLQLARRARLREELLTTRWFTYETLAELRGTSVEATRFAVHKAGSTHRLLVVADGARTLVPAFQLTDQGEVRPDLAPVLEPLLAARMDPWRAWIWLTQPAGLLGGLVPEQATGDPETVDLVLHAAVRLAEQIGAQG